MDAGALDLIDTRMVWLTGLASVVLAFAVGYSLYRLLRIETPDTPNQHGRQWVAYFLFLASATNLPRFFIHQDADSLLPWLVVVIFVGPMVYLAGWGYAKFRAVRARQGTEKVRDDRLYEVVSNEISVKRIDKVLWTRVFAECDGDHGKAKARYIKERVRQLRKTSSVQAAIGAAERSSNHWGVENALWGLGAIILLWFGAIAIHKASPERASSSMGESSAPRVSSLPPQSPTPSRTGAALPAVPRPLPFTYLEGRAAALRGNYQLALAIWRPLAAHGDGDSINAIGWLYLHGAGVEKDPQQALTMFRIAESKGVVKARRNLGYMHEYGIGVAPDDRQAKYWYQKAAEYGDKVAQERLKAINLVIYKCRNPGGVVTAQDYPCETAEEVGKIRPVRPQW